MNYSQGQNKSSNICLRWLTLYLCKFNEAETRKSPEREPIFEAFIGLILGVIGILLIGAVDDYFVTKFKLDGMIVPLLSGAFGSSAVLLYGVYDVPLAQPRNVIGSYLFCSFIGVAVREICGYIGWPIWVTGAFAVGFSIFTMTVTKTAHPPAGAVALIAVIGGPSVVNLGFYYVVTSVCGSTFLVIFALVANNMVPTRQYPKFWW
jgi:CBS-domain-containing membrane protein